MKPDEIDTYRFSRVSSAAVLATIFLCGMFSLSGLSYWNQWQVEVAKTDDFARVLATAAAEQIGGSLRTIDLLIQHVGQYVLANDGETGPEVLESLNIQSRSFPEMAELVVTDRLGRARSIGQPGTRDASLRDFFLLQREMFPDNHVVIDGPLRDPETGEWQITLSRPLRGPDGGFRGVVAAVLKSNFFADPLQSTGMHGRGNVLLINVNGIVFGRFPYGDKWIGSSLSPEALADISPGGERSKSFRTGGSLDGEDEISVYREVPSYPLAVIAGVPVSTVKKTWWSGIVTSGAVLLFVGLVTVNLGLQFDRREQQRRRATEALAHLNEQLENRVDERTKALDQARKAYQNLFDGAIEGILIHRDFKPLLVNHAFARLFGLDDVSGVLALPSFLDLVGAEFRGAVIEATREVERSRQPASIEFASRDCDGEPLWCLNSIRPVEWDGSPAIQAAFVNITVGKLWQNQLAEAKEAAESANDLKSRFLAVASHDLRQPVQALAFYVNVLSKHIPEGEPEEILRRVVECTTSLSALLDSLMDVSRLDAGVVKPEIRPVLLGDLLERLWSLYCPLAEQQGVSLTVVPCHLHVRSDPVLLERVLNNLVTNAIRYTPSGGKVLVGCRRAGARVVLQVIDTGEGISEKLLSRVFDEFFRIGRSGGSRGTIPGFGLGLSIVHRLCRLLGHPLAVRSRVDHGSTFAVELARVRAEVPLSEPAGVAVTQASFPNCVVLVIDNDDRVRESLRLQLLDWGLEVMAASRIEQAVELAERRRPRLILCDYCLDDGETGEAAIAAIAGAIGFWPRVILLTGETAPQPEGAGFAFRVLHKPVRPDALWAVLAEEFRDPVTRL